jgi:hypothetical protein
MRISGVFPTSPGWPSGIGGARERSLARRDKHTPAARVAPRRPEAAQSRAVEEAVEAEEGGGEEGKELMTRTE